MMFRIMTIVTDRNKPFDRLFSNISLSITFMMDLCCSSTTIHTPPIVTLEYYITLSFPFV